MLHWDLESRNKLWILLSLLLIISCNNYPLQQQWPDPLEFESVWQYLNVYSIYQERLPENAFIYNTPQEMMKSMGDTLKGDNYTCYESGYFSSLGLKSASDVVVTYTSINSSTGLLRIRAFNTGDTYNQLLSCLPKAARCSQLIIDLRGNLGGDIEELDSVVEAFLPPGQQFIMARERDYDPGSRIAKTLEWHPWVTVRAARSELTGKEITVLIDNMTASAAEILVAALKDCYSARLIGQKTYGKAIGQILLSRRNRPGLKITFLQLRGVSDRIGEYRDVGIQPDSLAIYKSQANPLNFDNVSGGCYKVVYTDSVGTPSYH